MVKVSVALATVDIPVPPAMSTVSKLFIVWLVPLSPDNVQLGDIGISGVTQSVPVAVDCNI